MTKQITPTAAAYTPTAAPESKTALNKAGDTELNLIEKMQEARAKAEEQRQRFQLPKNTNYGDAPIEAYARLARARTTAQVQSASSYAARQISRLKAAMSSDPDNASRIRAAINQLQKAQNRAVGKRRQLNKEHLLELRRKRAAQEKKNRKSQQLKYELNRRRTLRMIREGGYINEAAIDNRLQTQLAAAQMELKAQMQAISGAYGSASGQSGQSYGVGQYSAVASSVQAAPALSLDMQI